MNSVTDEYYIAAQSETDSQQNSVVKREMIRYLSRVADRTKPLFVFNQKHKLGLSEDSDDSNGTPRFSVVSFVLK